VDYATATSHTTYGAIGIKVWIYKSKFGQESEQELRNRARPARRTVAAPGGATGPKGVPAEQDNGANKANLITPPETNSKSE
jgi:ribosomal protein S3